MSKFLHIKCAINFSLVNKYTPERKYSKFTLHGVRDSFFKKLDRVVRTVSYLYDAWWINYAWFQIFGLTSNLEKKFEK